MTLEPDGTAAACKAASSGFDSHRRLFQASDGGCIPASGAPALKLGESAGRVPDMGSNAGCIDRGRSWLAQR